MSAVPEELLDVTPDAPDALTLHLPDEDATAELGNDLAMALRPSDAVALRGDLGMGKTALARAVVRALNGPDTEVPSPTFTLAQDYPDGALPVLHLDLYRLSDPTEVDELGIEDARERGAVLIEWPERGDVVPTLTVSLTEHGEGRAAIVTGTPDATARLRRSLAIRDFLGQHGLADAPREALSADASTRRYEAVERDGDRLLVMDDPHAPDGPPVRGALPYSRIAHLAEDIVPFVAVAEALRARGFAAPAILGADLHEGLALIEHLGCGSVLDDHGRPIPERYVAAAETLAALHDERWGDPMALPGGVAHVVPPFDRGAMTIEIELTLDWAFPRLVGRAATGAERAAFLQAWDAALDALDAAAETSLVLRDVQAPNLVWREGEAGITRVGLIDFQDAMIGPAAYDLASLGQDARVTIPPDLEAAIRDAYSKARRTPVTGDPDLAYAVMAAQRATKLFGLWVRLAERDGKPHYLANAARTRLYFGRVLNHPALARVAEWMGEHDLLVRSERMHP